jgi:hypothetical protein
LCSASPGQARENGLYRRVDDHNGKRRKRMTDGTGDCFLDKETLQLIAQLPIGIVALWALIMSMRAMNQLRAREIDVEAADKANEKLRIERETAVELVHAETQNAIAQNQTTLQSLVTKQISDNTNFSRQLMGLTAQMQQVLADNAREMHARAVAANEQATALDNLGSILTLDIAAIGDRLQAAFSSTVNHASEQMRASREATDAQLSSIKAGVEYLSAALDATQTVIDTLPLDTTKVVLEIGDKALNDHARIQAAVDAIAKQIAQLPAYFATSLAPVVDELRSANQQLQATESALINVVKTVIPPPREVALVAPGEAQPLSERDSGGTA